MSTLENGLSIRYRGVFLALRCVLQTQTGLWEGDVEDCEYELDEDSIRAQAEVVYALLDETTRFMDQKRVTADKKRLFFLR